MDVTGCWLAVFNGEDPVVIVLNPIVPLLFQRLNKESALCGYIELICIVTLNNKTLINSIAFCLLNEATKIHSESRKRFRSNLRLAITPSKSRNRVGVCPCYSNQNSSILDEDVRIIDVAFNRSRTYCRGRTAAPGLIDIAFMLEGLLLSPQCR